MVVPSAFTECFSFEAFGADRARKSPLAKAARHQLHPTPQLPMPASPFLPRTDLLLGVVSSPKRSQNKESVAHLKRACHTMSGPHKKVGFLVVCVWEHAQPKPG